VGEEEYELAIFQVPNLQFDSVFGRKLIWFKEAESDGIL
jgi:hypothetical protein